MRESDLRRQLDLALADKVRRGSGVCHLLTFVVVVLPVQSAIEDQFRLSRSSVVDLSGRVAELEAQLAQAQRQLREWKVSEYKLHKEGEMELVLFVVHYPRSYRRQLR